MTEVKVQNGDVELAVETFGSPEDPAVLLVMGVMASMIWWPKEFCEMIAARGRFVIRYDNRDTGLSTTWPVGAPGYSFVDLADDAIAILDAFRIDAAHVVGISMGGMIAQQIALRHPKRVQTLTAISTSPLGIKGLPPMTAAYLKHSETAEAVDWSDRESVVDYMIRDAAVVAGTAHPHDPDAVRDVIEQDFDRARNFASATNHFLLSGDDDGPEPMARDIRAPVLVIHGTSDPIFPIEHGQAFADTLPDARLLTIPGGGHELHRNDWPVMVDAITEHSEDGSRRKAATA